MSEIRMNRWLLALLYILAFILLWEWLIPVMELTSTGKLWSFLSFIILSFILSFFSAKWWVTVPLKIIYIFGVVHLVYVETALPSLSTISVLVNDFTSNYFILMNGEGGNMTNPFRTTLFFVLLWMTTYLIRHWIETKRSILLFYIMTVLFIAIIDTFSAYSADKAIYRIMATGLLLLGLLFISRLANRHKTVVSSRTLVSISIPLLLMIVVSGLIVTTFPKQDPIWPDPVPYFTSFVQGTTGKGVAKSGYDPNDSKLGGPFIEDDTLVFEATVDSRRYWKIETKNTYTSKGWEQPIDEGKATIYYPSIAMGEYDPNESIDSKQLKLANVNMVEEFPFLIYPYGMTKVITDYDVYFLHLIDNGQYRIKYGIDESPLNSYEIEYVDHEFSLKVLRETTMESMNSIEEGFSEYLQLPEELPGRVGELAKTITASSESVYDKTKAIERYFGTGGFRYDRENIAIPGEEDDYVDQFLFDTMVGYCDNFSTSMVVMLRTVGIPARWVKGFAPGEVVRSQADKRVYHISNNEAHSWVEAYMPGIGWMPFEPTIGFDGPATINYDIELEANDPEIKEMPKKEQVKQDQPKKKKNEQSSFDINKLVAKENLQSIFWSTVGLLAISWALYGFRQRWLPHALVFMHKSSKDDWNGYAKKYRSLLKQLDRSGLKRMNGQTLASYAVQVDAYFGGDMMTGLTKAYEIGIYGDDKSSHDWQRLQGMWEELIKRTSN